MNIIFMGPPGVGKGSQSYFLSKKIKVPIISSSELLKKEISKKEYLSKKMEQGCLINDEFVIQLVVSRIKKKDCELGFILDGFPRTINQAKELNRVTKINYIFNLCALETTLIKRINGRRIHIPSGKVFNVDLLKRNKKKENFVNIKDLSIRIDDNEKTIKKRLLIYNKKTQPIINFYEKNKEKYEYKFIHINSEKNIYTVRDIIFNLINKKN